jgi:hypothetical protein
MHAYCTRRCDSGADGTLPKSACGCLPFLLLKRTFHEFL